MPLGLQDTGPAWPVGRFHPYSSGRHYPHTSFDNVSTHFDASSAVRSRSSSQPDTGTENLIPVTNPIESVFATVRHRTVRTKGALSQKTARLMVFKLVMSAARTWRRLKGENQLPMVVAGVKFTDGVAEAATANQRAA